MNLPTVGSEIAFNVDELAAKLDKLLIDSNPFNVAYEIWERVSNGEDITVIRTSFQKDEPVMAAKLGVEVTEDVQNIAVINPQSNTASMVVVAAAQQITSRLGGNFILVDGGVTINPDAPPTLEQAYDAVRAFMNMKDAATALDDYSTWNLGAVLDEMEAYFGSDFDLSEAIPQTEKSYNTAITALGVYRRFRNERFNLPYSHHKEAFYSKIDDDDKLRVLKIAEEDKMSVRDLKSLCCAVRDNRINLDELEADPVRRAETVRERAARPPIYFRINPDGNVFRTRLALTEIVGPCLIFDARKYQAWAYNEEGARTELPITEEVIDEP